MKRVGVKLASAMMLVLLVAGCSREQAEDVNQNTDAQALTAVSTDKVQQALASDDWVVVDTRLNDAFNGWKLDGVSRGGHIKGAVDFSANWLRVKAGNKTELLAETLKTKGLTKDKQVILYDVNGQDAKQVAAFLQGKGFDQVYLYDLNQWAANDNLPLEKYKNFHLIVPATVVKSLIDGERPETFEHTQQVKIVEASWGEEKTSYSNGHVPSAFHINTDDIEPPATQPPMMWMLADDAALKSVAAKYGFHKDDTVIMTGEEPLAAFRLATVLRYIGVNDVRVLNGGNTAWTMAGFALETKSHKPVPNDDFGAPIPGRADVIDTMAEVRTWLNQPDNFTLVDNRTWDEYIGKSSGYSYHDKKGRVPGAIFGYAGKSSSYSMEYYRNPDNTMRNASEILTLWHNQGIDTQKRLSFMCGSGWRVAEVYTYADVIGLNHIGIFSDGWIGWSNDASNPTVTGEPKE